MTKDVLLRKTCWSQDPVRLKKGGNMSQTKQLKKAKLYRALKIVFYTLGLPLFFFAVICTAIKFIGEDPFVGLAGSSLSSGIYVGYERFINSPALYGIWCALAVWVFIVICHAIVSKAFKGFRTRLFSMLAIILVVMLGTMGIMDAAFSAKIDKIAAKAPAGVTVQDYKTQLSYYDYVSYYRKDSSLINQLMSQVQHLEEVYHVEWQGIDKSGEAGNIANKPVTYKNIIDDEGNVGAGDKSDALVEVAPKNGKLVIDGKTYNGYFCITRTGMTGTTVHVWYSKDMLPVGSTSKKGAMKFNTTDGVYGEGLYNESGLLSDGWVFSFENVLEILEDYYAGQQFLATADQTFVEEIKNNAEELRKAYYAGTAELPSRQTRRSSREGSLRAGSGDGKQLLHAARKARRGSLLSRSISWRQPPVRLSARHHENQPLALVAQHILDRRIGSAHDARKRHFSYGLAQHGRRFVETTHSRRNRAGSIWCYI